MLRILLLTTATALVVLAAGLSSLVTVALGPSHWLAALDQSRAYEEAPAAIAEQLAAPVSGRPAGEAGPLGLLGPSDIEVLVLAVATPAWLRDQASVVIPPLVEGLAATGEIRGIVPLAPLQERLPSAAFEPTVVARIMSWPECTASQLGQLAGGTLVRCRPRGALEVELSLGAAAALSRVAAELPTEIDLAAVVPGAIGERTASPGSSSGITGPLRAVAVARPLVTSLVLVVVLVLAAATLVSGLTVRSTLRALAVPLVIGGVLVLLLGWVSGPIVASATEGGRVTVAGAGAAPRFVAIGASLAGAMVDQVRSQVVQAGLALTTGGLLLLWVRWLLSRR